MDDEKENESKFFYERYKELVNLVVGFFLTAIVGSFITHSYQERAYLEAKRSEDLNEERAKAFRTLEEMSTIIDTRHYRALLLLDAIENVGSGTSPERYADLQRASDEYKSSVHDWNLKWNLGRAMIRRSFGKALEKRFYSFEADLGSDWSAYSITGKMRMLHLLLVEAKEAVMDEKVPDLKRARNLYDAVGHDVYEFYDELVGQMQTGDLGIFIHRP